MSRETYGHNRILVTSVCVWSVSVLWCMNLCSIWVWEAPRQVHKGQTDRQTYLHTSLLTLICFFSSSSSFHQWWVNMSGLTRPSPEQPVPSNQFRHSPTCYLTHEGLLCTVWGCSSECMYITLRQCWYWALCRACSCQVVVVRAHAKSLVFSINVLFYRISINFFFFSCGRCYV